MPEHASSVGGDCLPLTCRQPFRQNYDKTLDKYGVFAVGTVVLPTNTHTKKQAGIAVNKLGQKLWGFLPSDYDADLRIWRQPIDQRHDQPFGHQQIIA